MIETIILTALLFASAPAQQTTPLQFGYYVQGVYDGDTITVSLQGTVGKVRLAHIDAPERKQAYGLQAQQYLAKMALYKHVGIRGITYDKYRRLIGEVYYAGTWFNQEMVRAGYAWHYKAYSRDKTYDQLEERARALRLGLWRDPNPIPPWEWRKQQDK